MRLRKNNARNEQIKQYSDIVYIQGKTDNELDLIDNIILEIGMGKGDFLTSLAEKNKNDFFIGIETHLDIAYIAALKIREKNLSNIKIIQANAEAIDTWFIKKQIQTFYINFCDPWPKAKHAKRRLVARNFLKKYQQIAAKDAILLFKTDNKNLFEFALEELDFCGFKIIEQSSDLHKSEINNPFWTEYENKFNKLGMPIYFLKSSFPR